MARSGGQGVRDGEPFVEVRLPPGAAILAPLTKAHPDLVVDACVNLGVSSPQQAAINATAILRGSPAAIEAAIGRLTEIYAIRPRPLASGPQRRILAFDIDQSRLRHSLLGTLIATQVAHGYAWLHISKGAVLVRSPAPDPDAAQARLRHVLRLADVSADAAIVHLAGDDQSTWRDLLKHAA